MSIRVPPRNELLAMSGGNQRLAKFLEELANALNTQAVPKGGATGQQLTKQSANDFDVGWT